MIARDSIVMCFDAIILSRVLYHYLLGKDNSVQQILMVCSSCLLKQIDGKLSQTILMYLKIDNCDWHFLNRL